MSLLARWRRRRAFRAVTTAPAVISLLPIGVPQGSRGIRPMPLLETTESAFRRRSGQLTVRQISVAARSPSLSTQAADLAIAVCLGRVANVLASMPPLDADDASASILSHTGHAAYVLTRIALGTEHLSLRYSGSEPGGLDGCVARLLTRSSTIDPAALDRLYDPLVYRALRSLTEVDPAGPHSDTARKGMSLMVMSGVGLAIAEMELYGEQGRIVAPLASDSVIDLRDGVDSRPSLHDQPTMR